MKSSNLISRMDLFDLFLKIHAFKCLFSLLLLSSVMYTISDTSIIYHAARSILAFFNIITLLRVDQSSLINKLKQKFKREKFSGNRIKRIQVFLRILNEHSTQMKVVSQRTRKTNQLSQFNLIMQAY